jgi:acetyl esterase/lipase
MTTILERKRQGLRIRLKANNAEALHLKFLVCFSLLPIVPAMRASVSGSRPSTASSDRIHSPAEAMTRRQSAFRVLFASVGISLLANPHMAAAFANLGTSSKTPAFASVITSKNSFLHSTTVAAPIDTTARVPETRFKVVAPKTIVYEPLTLPLKDFGVEVPVACWYGSRSSSPSPTTSAPVSYEYRISVRRIGQLLAKWNFIPEFASRVFQLPPTNTRHEVVSSTGGLEHIADKTRPVVLLAHGFLGSRFDLSHLAEEIAATTDAIVFSPEYPESLGASYDRTSDALDRTVITDALLSMVKSQLRPSAYGAIGHSLGCGTVLKTGTKDWARICLAGYPRQYNNNNAPVPGNVLIVTSVNDGLISMMTKMVAKQQGISSATVKTPAETIAEMIPSDFDILKESDLLGNIKNSEAIAAIPTRSILVYDRSDSPNHISYLTGSVNDAMIDFLSPLLPVAQLFQIPVLDFDQYQNSRDSDVTSQSYFPIVLTYLQQELSKQQQK